MRWLALAVLGLTAPTSAEGRFASFGGARVYFESYGEGDEAIVLVHGWAADAGIWRFQVPAFEKQFRVITLDLPGHGRSDAPERFSYDQAQLADSIEAVLRGAGVRRAVVVGHSMGAHVAVVFQQRHPDRVVGLALIDGFLRAPPPSPRHLALMAAFESRDFQTAMAAFIDSMMVPNTPEWIRLEAQRVARQTPYHVVLRAAKGLHRSRQPRLRRIHVPVLALMALTADSPKNQERWFRWRVDDCDYRVWANSSHFMMMEEPERFNRVVLDFANRAWRANPPSGPTR